MKRLYGIAGAAALTVLTLAVGLCACGKKQEQKETETSTILIESEETTAEETATEEPTSEETTTAKETETTTEEETNTSTAEETQETTETPHPAHHHTYTESVILPATCQDEGVTEYRCTGCDDVYTEPIPQLVHEFEAEVTKEAGCEETGRRNKDIT